MPLPKAPEATVPISMYNDLMAKYHAVVEKFMESTAPKAGTMRVTPAPPPPEERAMARAHDEFVEQAAAHFVATGANPAEARAEAERLRKMVEEPMGAM